MKKNLVLLFVLIVFTGSKAMAQEQEKLHGAAKHHRSPDAQTSHKSKKHVAEEEQKNAPAKPFAAQPKVTAPKPAHKPVAAKHVAKQPGVKSAVVKQPAVTHIPAKHVAVKHKVAKQPVVSHKQVTHHQKVQPASVYHVTKRSNTVINQENITVNEHKPSTEIEIKNGNVLINDSFVFKIKSLRNEDDKITINTIVAQVIKSNQYDNSNGSQEEEEEYGNHCRPMLGVYTIDAPKGGAKIESVVHGSPADKIGFKEGDIITGVNDRKIDNSQDLVYAVSKYKPGERVTVTRLNNGEEEIAVVVLAKAGEMENERGDEMPEPHPYYKKFCHGRWR